MGSPKTTKKAAALDRPGTKSHYYAVRTHALNLVVIALLSAIGQLSGHVFLRARVEGALPTFSSCPHCGSLLATGGLGDDGAAPVVGDHYSMFLRSVPPGGDWPPPLDVPPWSIEATRGDYDREKNRGPVTLTTCIPALARNVDSDLPPVLRSISNQTVAPDEVAIVVSEVVGDATSSLARHWADGGGGGDAWCRELLARSREIVPDVPVKVVCIGDRLTAGWARNVLSRVAGSEVLSYIDADDEEYPVRNEVTKKMFDCYRGRLSLLLHDFSGRESGVVPLHSYEQKERMKGRGADHYQCPDEEESLLVWHGDRLYDRVGETHKRWILTEWLAHGHMIVHRRVFEHVRFISAMKGEDAMFLRDTILTYGRDRNSSIYLHRPLSWYSGQSKTSWELMEA